MLFSASSSCSPWYSPRDERSRDAAGAARNLGDHVGRTDRLWGCGRPRFAGTLNLGLRFADNAIGEGCSRRGGGELSLIIKTEKSIYEVREDQRQFRRVHFFGLAPPELPIGTWFQYQRMSPVVVGEPVRFFWLKGEEAGLTRIGLWTTSPVVEVLTDAEEPTPRSTGRERPAASGEASRVAHLRQR